MIDFEVVIERLRAAGTEDARDASACGSAAGAAWAAERARPRELQRLGRSLRAWGGGRPVGAVLAGVAARGDRIAVFLCAIVAGGDPDGLEASVFFGDLLG